ncbi:MAG: class I SAM-dependent methyltransferase [Cyanobacteria bacterium P01_E01_bin.42]
MSQLESAEKLTGVAETLMITLYSRAVETQRDDSFFQDPKAVEIVERTRYDFEKYEQGWGSLLGVILRSQTIDRLVQTFLATHPDAVVINLGSGLCTRFTRLDNGRLHWYEVDFPETIELRRKFFSESDRYQFIAQSILDFTWLDRIQRAPEQPLLVIMEGVSMYLTEADNRAIINTISDRLAPTNFIFDVVSPRVAKNSKRHDTVSKTDAEFQFGIEKSKDLEMWGKGITLREEIFYLVQFSQHPQRLPWWARYFSFLLVPLFKNSGRVVNLELLG